MVNATPTRPEAQEARPPDDDGVRWLALLLLKVAVILANGIRSRYLLNRGEKCPRCGHAF